ncbi:hypothetical protein MNV49_004574 [Pseudohyphozyma bogoriensis]|nr:hypothetical protein MNV49_004574 [Pseudohyphozyma bogoriensis]
MPEATPLLKPNATTPLPVGQMLVLCFMRMTEPVVTTMIPLFLVALIRDSGVTSDPKKVGYYVGAIETAFALVSFSTVVGWGRLSDLWGRKPVLICGLAGIGSATVLLGFSHRFASIFVIRAVGRAFNGNAGVVKTIMGDITDGTNFARAFSFIPLSW